jgi:arabinogalactan oligomer/maltooligosaccharide transport system permease protein
MKLVRHIKNYFADFAGGDWALRASYLLPGFYQYKTKQIGRGVLYSALFVLFVVFMIVLGAGFLVDLVLLARVPRNAAEMILGDNAFTMMLFGIITILYILLMLILYCLITAHSRRTYKAIAMGGYHKVGFVQDLRSLLDGNFHIAMMTLPIIFITLFVLVPIIFTILIAFTNYASVIHPDSVNGVNMRFFQWAGFDAFLQLFGGGNAMMGSTFFGVLWWTLLWAVLATFSNYFLGILTAVGINTPGLRFKKVYRLTLVVSIAIPSFITLMVLRTFLLPLGVFNNLLQSIGLTSQPIFFLSGDPWVARVTVLIANLWIGIPFTMLIATGVLYTIPKELYEAAKIDGAGAVKLFTKITMPYVLFVTSPYLIAAFIGNINNFNVIFLLTEGGPFSSLLYYAGHTDLLITWLFRLNSVSRDFAISSVISIFIFLFSAGFALLVYTRTGAYKRENEFG